MTHPALRLKGVGVRLGDVDVLEGVTLDLDGTQREISQGGVADARVQIEFNRKES